MPSGDSKQLVICISGYVAKERQDVMALVGALGGSYSGALTCECTHLVCRQFEGKKYERAKMWPQIKIVNHRWLEDSVAQGRCLSADPYTSYSGQQVGPVRALTTPSHLINAQANQILPEPNTTPQNLLKALLEPRGPDTGPLKAPSEANGPQNLPDTPPKPKDPQEISPRAHSELRDRQELCITPAQHRAFWEHLEPQSKEEEAPGAPLEAQSDQVNLLAAPSEVGLPEGQGIQTRKRLKKLKSPLEPESQENFHHFIFNPRDQENLLLVKSRHPPGPKKRLKKMGSELVAKSKSKSVKARKVLTERPKNQEPAQVGAKPSTSGSWNSWPNDLRNWPTRGETSRQGGEPSRQGASRKASSRPAVELKAGASLREWWKPSKKVLKAQRAADEAASQSAKPSHSDRFSLMTRLEGHSNLLSQREPASNTVLATAPTTDNALEPSLPRVQACILSMFPKLSPPSPEAALASPEKGICPQEGPAAVTSPSPTKEHGYKCVICLGANTPGKQGEGTLACGHSFCYVCIRTWAQKQTACPVCRVSFTSITKRTVQGGGELAVDEEVKVSACEQRADVDAYISDRHCEFCGQGTDEAMLLLCDNCDKGAHTFCLVPPLTVIPEGDWFCQQCELEQRRRAQPRGPFELALANSRRLGRNRRLTALRRVPTDTVASARALLAVHMEPLLPAPAMGGLEDFASMLGHTSRQAGVVRGRLTSGQGRQINVRR